MNTKSVHPQYFIHFKTFIGLVMAVASAAHNPHPSRIICDQNHLAFVSLIPSQAISSKEIIRKTIKCNNDSYKSTNCHRTTHLNVTPQHFPNNDNAAFLVPSQAITKAHLDRSLSRNPTRLMASTRGEEESLTVTSPPLSESNSSGAKTNVTPTRKKKKHNFKYYGNIPDIHWRAIPMEHLRSHPYYQPLPHPDTIKVLHSLEDVRIFRQDSWQWDALHQGRCTTSQAAPALGLLEPSAARALGIPRSLQKGCMGAFRRLSQPALRTLEEMNEILCTAGNGGDKKLHKVWREIDELERGRRFPFAAKYTPTLTKEELDARRREAKQFLNNISSPMRIRMSWGNAQEATSVLTALNHFVKQDPGLQVLEVGMCGAGLDLNVTTDCEGNSPQLIVGASPDSVIKYSNGTLEVLEVKNHCPFVPSDWAPGSKAQKMKKKAFGDYRIRELPLQFSVPPAYIPQLMMEMMSCGENCRSAIMVRQTATCGAVILRIYRDDKWIEEMTFWLKKFMTEYVEKDTSPPPDFFWEDGEDSDRYRAFVKRTKELSEEVELVEHVKNNNIQRVLGARGLKLPLFLD